MTGEERGDYKVEIICFAFYGYFFKELDKRERGSERERARERERERE